MKIAAFKLVSESGRSVRQMPGRLHTTGGGLSSYSHTGASAQMAFIVEYASSEYEKYM